MQLLRNTQETAVAISHADLAGEGLKRLGHFFGVSDKIEFRAVVKKASPLGIERDQIDMFPQNSFSLTEDPFENRGQGQNGWPHVETETLTMEHRGLAAKPTVSLEKSNLVTTGGESTGSRQPTQTTADNSDPFFRRHGHGLLPSFPVSEAVPGSIPASGERRLLLRRDEGP